MMMIRLAVSSMKYFLILIYYSTKLDTLSKVKTMATITWIIPQVLALSVVAVALAQQRFDPAPQEKPHVAILKQINQINKDGSYVSHISFT